jgi:RNA polymerase sigma factor (sigma-70 family)
MKDLSEEELLEKCKSGHRPAFNEIVRRNHDRVYRVVFRLVGNYEDALDISQDVFVKAWTSIRDFRGDSQIFTWLYTIATNLGLNHIRKRKLRRSFSFEKIEEFHPNTDAGPDRITEREELRKAIDSAVSKLPEKQKAVFILRYFEDLSYEDISRILHTSIGGLKANYFHALRKIERHVRSSM